MQSIIVYRNPVEAAFWDIFMTDPLSMILFFLILAAAFAVGLFVYNTIDKWWSRQRFTQSFGSNKMPKWKMRLYHWKGYIAGAAALLFLYGVHLFNMR